MLKNFCIKRLNHVLLHLNILSLHYFRFLLSKCLTSLGCVVIQPDKYHFSCLIAHIFRFFLIILFRRPEVVFGWLPLGMLLSSIFCFSSRVVWSAHNSDLIFKTTSFLLYLQSLNVPLSWLLKPELIFCSYSSLRYFRTLYYCCTNSVVVLNGIDIQIYKPFSCDRNKTIGISDETFVIGMFARYARQKDHETFFKSLAHLSLTIGCFHVILAGHGINRDNIELEQLLEKYRLSSHVSLLGERQDLLVFTTQ